MIEWSDKFLIENEMVDLQHEMLVERFNKLVLCSRNKETRNDKEFIICLMDDLLSYVIYHFEMEEILMKETKYDDIRNHSDIHEKFIAYIRKAKGDIISGKDILDTFVLSLKKWAERHILEVDKKTLGPHFKHFNQTQLERYMKNLENDLNPNVRRRRHSFASGISVSLISLSKITSIHDNLSRLNFLKRWVVCPIILSCPSLIILFLGILCSSVLSSFWIFTFPILGFILIFLFFLFSICICGFSCCILSYYKKVVNSISQIINSISEMDDLSTERKQISNLEKLTFSPSLPKSINQLLLSMENYSKYVPLDFLQSVVRKNELVQVGLNTRYITILFNDIQNFTTLCEEADPNELLKFLQDFYRINDSCVWETSGTVIAQTGDGIMAIWNAPKWCLEHEEKSIRCALAIRERLETVEFNGRSVIVRFGINSSSCLIGNIGSENRLSYNIFGDGVNVSSRLEGANKLYQTRILFSNSTFMGVRDRNRFYFRWIDKICVKGKHQSITVYEVKGVKKMRQMKMKSIDLEEYVKQQEEKNKKLFLKEEEPDEPIEEIEEIEEEEEYDDDEPEEYVKKEKKKKKKKKILWRCRLCGYEERSDSEPHQCQLCGAKGMNVWEEINWDEGSEYECEDEELEQVIPENERIICKYSFLLKKLCEENKIEEAKKVCLKILGIDERDVPAQLLLRRLKEGSFEAVELTEK